MRGECRYVGGAYYPKKEEEEEEEEDVGEYEILR